MYKTIRHGENSLQYTILPQNDDFRIEGKLSGSGRAGSAGGGATSTASVKAKGQRRRRSFFAYLGLIFVCTVIIGAVLIPFLVSAECLPNPAEWFLKTKAALIHSPQPGGGDSIGTSSTLATGSPLLQQNVGRNVQIVNRNGIEQFVIRVNKTNPSASTTSSTTTGPSTVATSSSSSSSTSTTTTTTTVPAPTSTSTTTTTTKAPPVTTPRYPAPPPPPPATTITTRIIQVPLLKSAAKKPIMPPVLAKAQGPQIHTGAGQNSRLQAQAQAGTEHESLSKLASNRRAEGRRATGYKDEDSVLLPALLGFALIGVILIITVCLVARNKRTIVSSVRKRNRNVSTLCIWLDQRTGSGRLGVRLVGGA
ncbi:GD15745 [Drosophila simulans]|uniref:GD15745 n=1 Tax=Drosophila simulans TaxID=7240 RepID=B4R5U6_DROSI|nr:GD15745 [Drosophila simulans]